MTLYPFSPVRPERNIQRRISLPVSPCANTRIRFAAITDRPVVALTPNEAVGLVERVMRMGDPIVEVDIAGPGEPLATPHATFECLSRVHGRYPSLSLGMITNGLGGARLLNDLRESGLCRIILCVDTVTTVTAAQMYAWIRPGNRTLPLSQAADILVREQGTMASACAETGIAVRIATTVYPGFNDREVEEIALKMSGAGVEEMILQPYQPAPGDLGGVGKPDGVLMAELARQAARHLRVISSTESPRECGWKSAFPPEGALLPKPVPGRPNVAVTSESGLAIDQHLGEASRLLIYGPREDGLVCLLAIRPAPAPGCGERWQTLAETASDCFALLTAAAGETPCTALDRGGLPVMISDGGIEETVDALYGNGRKNNETGG